MTVSAMTLYNYGRFVEYAYEMYAESIQGGGAPNLTPPLPSDFPIDEYKLLTYLVADDKFNQQYPTQFYGFYAVNINDPEEIIIAIRGTESIAEWESDAEFALVPFSEVSGGGKVCQGFHEIFQTFAIMSEHSTIEERDFDFRKPVQEMTANGVRAVMVGHSLGSALANLFSLDIVANATTTVNLDIYPFASPKTGDITFQQKYNATISSCTRVTNEPDFVPTLPPGSDYYPVGQNYEIDSTTSLNVKNSIPCYHSLLTYLFMLNSDNPFGLASECRNF